MVESCYTEPLSVVKVALDPSPRQARQLDAFDRAACFAFNWTLSIAKREIAVAWESVHGFGRFWSFYSMRKLWNQWKPVAFPEWQGVSKEALASGIRDACGALDNWYDSLVGRRRGRPVGLPRFRSRYSLSRLTVPW